MVDGFNQFTPEVVINPTGVSQRVQHTLVTLTRFQKLFHGPMLVNSRFKHDLNMGKRIKNVNMKFKVDFIISSSVGSCAGHPSLTAYGQPRERITMQRPRVKICCMASVEEARICAAHGVDLVGLVGPMPSGAGVITPGKCREISDAACAWVTPVLLTSSETAQDVRSDVEDANVRAVQLVRHVEPSVHRELALTLPHVRRFQVIHVEDGSALDLIEVYAGLADAFLLDSGRPSAAELGGTGRVHDWDISAEFVRRSPVPVFLAGGLKPSNVAGAMQRVRPFGLDICSGVRTAEDRLDPAKLAAFMSAIAGASAGTD